MKPMLTSLTLISTLATIQLNPGFASEVRNNMEQTVFTNEFSLNRLLQEELFFCDFETNEFLSACNSTLYEYDVNGDGFINRGPEFVNFVMDLIGNDNYVEGSVSFSQLYPLQLVGIFNNAACDSTCEDGNENCLGCSLDVTLQDENVVCYLCDRLKRFIDSLEAPTSMPSGFPSESPTSSPTVKPSTAPTTKPVPSPSALPTCGADATMLTIQYPLSTRNDVDAAAILSGADNTVKKDLIDGIAAIVQDELAESSTGTKDPFYDASFPPSIDSVVDTNCDVDDIEYADVSDTNAVNCSVVTSSITIFAYCETDTEALKVSLGQSVRQALMGSGFCQYIS